jgi:RNA polymerase sigma-70 factor (ECF subfamily)
MRTIRRGSDPRRLADEELLGLVARRDQRAFEVLYDRHGPAAYSLAYRILGDAGRAEDVTQEAFVALWRSEAGYDPARGSVRSWLLGILRNRAIDVLRRSSAARAPRLDLGVEERLAEVPASDRTDAEAARREEARTIRGALAQLPPEQSQVIQLAYFGGFSQSEIASMLDTPLGTVKGRMRLGLEKARTLLDEAIR